MTYKNCFLGLVISCCLAVAGCGGGGGSSNTNAGSNISTSGTNSGSGGTNNNGNNNSGGNAPPSYNYFPGKQVAFTPSSGKVVAAYLPGYEIDGGYDLSKLPSGSVTHLLYAFLTICGPGQNASDAAVCASKNNFELAVNNATSDNAHHVHLLNFKQSAPNVKVLVSIGGGGMSNPFFYMAGDPAKRAVFINSVISYLNTHAAFDGVDIDWESPTNDLGLNNPPLGSPSDSQAYVDLLRELRVALNQLGAGNGRQYQLTSAVITLDSIVNAIDYAAAQVHVDYFFAMTYDYFGSWSSTVGHHSALYPASSQFGIQNLIAAGVAPAKLVQGVAMYSRGWGSCTDSVNPMQGTGDGNYNGAGGAEKYRTLATTYFDSSGNGINGYQVRYDTALHAYYLWNASTLTFIGYDDPRAVVEKGQYAVSQNLAGVFAWELGQDNGDILSAMNHGVGNQMQ